MKLLLKLCALAICSTGEKVFILVNVFGGFVVVVVWPRLSSSLVKVLRKQFAYNKLQLPFCSTRQPSLVRHLHHSQQQRSQFDAHFCCCNSIAGNFIAFFVKTTTKNNFPPFYVYLCVFRCGASI